MKEKDEIYVQLGEGLRKVRNATGLTQEEFAEMVSLAPKNLSDIERGKVGLSISSLVRICTVFSVSSDDILFGPTEKNNSELVMDRLANLPPHQFDIALDILNKVLEAFASTEQQKK